MDKSTSVGRPRKSESNLRTKNDARADLVRRARFSTHLSRSLQSNLEVRFRDAEICRMFNSDYRVRVHRSRGDSGQNEAERTNSAMEKNAWHVSELLI